jgi:hypothetical protein
MDRKVREIRVKMGNTRLDNELAECIEKWRWKYHNGAPIELIEFKRNENNV